MENEKYTLALKLKGMLEKEEKLYCFIGSDEYLSMSKSSQDVMQDEIALLQSHALTLSKQIDRL